MSSYRMNIKAVSIAHSYDTASLMDLQEVIRNTVFFLIRLTIISAICRAFEKATIAI